MEQDVLFQAPPDRSGRPYFLDLHRRPLLVYGKPAFHPAGVDDLITVPPTGGVARRPRPGRDRHGLDRQEVVPVRTDSLRPDNAGSGRPGSWGEEAGLHLHRRHGASVLPGPHPEGDDGSGSGRRWTIRNRVTQPRRNGRVAAHANPVGDALPRTSCRNRPFLASGRPARPARPAPPVW